MSNAQQPSATLLVSQQEAAHLLSVDRTTVWRMVQRGDLQQVRIGRRSLIARASLDAYICAQLGHSPGADK